jgi:glyoxylase-like metal-dependent hydrolase (beta-lactamase superfamily II)
LEGMPFSLADDMRNHLRGFRERVDPQPDSRDIVIVQPGERIRFGGVDWEAIAGEGHAPGHLSFYDRIGRRMLCGDQVLPDISPNIGWMPGDDPDPLGSFLDSLRELHDLGVDVAYPGHRDPFDQWKERVVELIDHHERRLAKMEELAGETPFTAFDMCEKLFGARIGGNPHQLRFALAETIAHLIVLVSRGKMTRAEEALPGTEPGRIAYYSISNR